MEAAGLIRGKLDVFCRQLEQSGKDVSIMEICGTHTTAIFRSGLRSLLPRQVGLISGPGCPVCVTPRSYIDLAVELAGLPGVILATFGDMIRVPGSLKSLAEARASGGDIRVVYSPLDALEIAEKNNNSQVVFLGVGFETTAPAVAATVLRARQKETRNFSILSAHRLVPPAVRALLAGKSFRAGAMLLPGHVIALTGTRPFDFITCEFGIPAAVAGFEPTEILAALTYLAGRHDAFEPGQKLNKVRNLYPRLVDKDGNKTAMSMVAKVFRTIPARWRGLGEIPGSGLDLSDEYSLFDAKKVFGLMEKNVPDPPGCRCGLVIVGELSPPDCPMFGKACTPESPAGPCMVSAEGSCAAHYKYNLDNNFIT